MLIKTNDKFEAIHAFINTWLKDKQIYCGNCDTDYNEATFPCCEEPVLETNSGHTKAIIEAIKDLKKDQINEFASNKEKNFRSTVKIPKRLYWDLDKYLGNYGYKLFDNEEDMLKFAKKFPQFSVPERI